MLDYQRKLTLGAGLAGVSFFASFTGPEGPEGDASADHHNK